MTQMTARGTFRTFLAALCAGIIAFPTLAGATGPELYFYPAQGWKVAPVPIDLVSSGGKNCVISNEFNNGFQVEIGGSSHQIDTLTINFIQPAFEQGLTYDVSMSVPGKVQKDLRANAPRPELLAITMSSEKDLYENLSTANVFDITIEQNEFRFYLTGFADAIKRFKACVATDSPAVAAPDPFEIIDAMITPNVSKDVYEIPFEEEDKKETGSSKTVASIEMITEKEEDVMTPILESMDKKPKPDGYERMSEKLAREMDNRKDTIKTIEVDAVKATSPTTTSMKTPEIKVTKTYSKMDTDFTGLGDVEPASSGAPFSDRHSGDGDMRIKMTNLERMVNRLSEENTALETELQKALREGEQERISLSSDNWNLEQATKRYNEAERQIDKLGRQLQRERGQCLQESQKLETMLFDPELTSTEQMARLTELERELERTKSKLAAYESRIRKLQGQP